MCSLAHLRSANSYSEIHAKNHLKQSNDSFNADFQESKEMRQRHVNGVYRQSLFHNFPFFSIEKQLPQCSSHDYLGTIHILRNHLKGVGIIDSRDDQKMAIFAVIL